MWHQGPVPQAVEVALRMLEAVVDGVGVHLQADARCAARRSSRATISVSGPRHLRAGRRHRPDAGGRQAQRRAGESLAQAGLGAFVISGNLRHPDDRARYDLPPEQIERYVAGFIAEVSSSSSYLFKYFFTYAIPSAALCIASTAKLPPCSTKKCVMPDMAASGQIRV
jgi:hypothetical protein